MAGARFSTSGRSASPFPYVGVTASAHRGRTLLEVTRLVGALAIAAAVLGIAASAADALFTTFTPAWTYLPPQVRSSLAAKLHGTLYLPSKTPAFYRYRAGATVSRKTLAVRFTNRVRVRAGLWRWTRQSFLWQVHSLPASQRCTDWKPVDTTWHLAGNTVFWSAADATAWRCATDRTKHTHVLSASEGGSLPAVALGIVVARGLDAAGR